MRCASFDGVKSCASLLQGLTPLLTAAKNGNAEVMRELIGAKADQTTMDGTTTSIELLLYATKLKQGNVAHALEVSTADVNTRNAVRRCDQGS
jgi:hypothetical protein